MRFFVLDVPVYGDCREVRIHKQAVEDLATPFVERRSPTVCLVEFLATGAWAVVKHDAVVRIQDDEDLFVIIPPEGEQQRARNVLTGRCVGLAPRTFYYRIERPMGYLARQKGSWKWRGVTRAEA